MNEERWDILLAHLFYVLFLLRVSTRLQRNGVLAILQLE